MKSEIKMGIRGVACVALLSVVACGASPTPPPTAPDAGVAPAAGTAADVAVAQPKAGAAADRSLAPVAEAALQFSDEQLALLCGPEQSAAGAATLPQLQREMLSLDVTVEEHFQKLMQATAADCGAAAKELYAQFEAEMAASRTVCDNLVPYGIGIKGDELDAQTEALRKTAEERNAAMLKDKATCTAKRLDQITAIARWRGARGALCSPTPAQLGVVECGTLSSSAAKQQSAKAFCQKDAPADARDQSHKALVQCLGPNARSTAASERGLDGNRAPAPTIPTPSLETRLLTGTTEFFEARAKEEAKLFAYEVVKDHLCNDESHVKPLLVNTCELLGSDETLAATPAAIREAVRLDLEALPVVLVGKIKKKRPELACGAALAWTFGSEAIEGADVLDLLSNPGPLVDAPLVKDPLASPACSVQVRTIIAQIADELKKRLDQDRNRLLSSVKEGDFARALASDGQNRALNLTEYEAVLKKVLERVRQLDQANQAWKKDPSRQNRAAVVTAGLRTIEPIIGFVTVKYATAEKAEQVGKAVTASIKLTGQLINQEYAASVVTAAGLASTAGLEEGKARNLLGLAAGLAQAESSDEVRATLEDAALPLGSWRRKNEKRVGLTLTGLVGIQAGHEFVLGKTPAEHSVVDGPAIAPTLLIGPDIHYGTGKGIRFGAQLSILDLGALLSFRTSKPTVDDAATTETANQTPDIKIEQVFSPGLYPYMGIGPFTFGPAFSFVPSLRQAGTAADKDRLNVIRVGGFASIDVSVLPLY